MLPILEVWRQKSAETPRSKLYMMRILTLLLIIGGLLGAVVGVLHQLTPARAASGDWPTYLHDVQRTGASDDTTLSSANVGQLTANWIFKTGGTIAASPTVVDGTVYVGSWDGYEYALNAATGAMIWKTFLGQTTAPCYPQLAGVSSAADVENGVVYVGGGDSYWYALDATTGTVLWKVFIGDNTKGWYNWASPLIYNGYAYVGTASVGDCPLVPGQLLQVSLTTHQVVNTFDVVPTGQYGGGIWTTPALDTATNTIFVTTGTRNQSDQTLSEAVVAIDATTLTLKSSWELPTSAETVDSDFASTPILFTDTNGDQLVAAVNKNGFAYVLNRNNLSAGLVWSRQIDVGGSCPQCGDGSASSAAFANNTLFIAGGSTVVNGQGYKGAVSALDPATGNLKWQHGTTGQVIPALAYSNGLIFDGAGATFEVLDASNGTRLYSYTTGGLLYAAPTISNGQVFTGGTDNNVYAFGLPSTIPPTPTPDPTCPSGWNCQDIGNPAPAGSETVSGSTWTASGGGTGVGGTADQFRFINQNVSGDTQISAQVVSQTGTGGAAQAGLLVRQSSDPASPYYAIFQKPNKLVVQYRLTFGGATTTVTQAGAASPPLYLEIQRVGDQFQAATSSDGVSYTLVPGASVIIPMPAITQQGVALSSGTQGVQNTATFSAVTAGSPTIAPNPPASADPCPSSWSCSDIGNPVTVGDQTLSAGTWTLQGAGNDIDNNADQFHFAWQSLAADGSISAHIVTQTNTNAAAKAGIMLRQSTGADSAYYAAFVTPGDGIVVQYRPVNGLKTQVITGPTTTVPTYLMIARSGSTNCAYGSSDGTNWNYIIGTCFDLNLGSSALAGLAVTSAKTGTASVVTFDTVTVSTTAPAPPTLCPSSWTCADIGYPIPPGSQTRIGNTWTIQAGGNDIYGTWDQFRFVAQTLAADGSVSAHITSQTDTNDWSKAGVMLRQSTDPASPYYAILATPANGIVVQYRTTQGGGAQQSAKITTGTVPTYLKIGRSGNTYTAYTSSDGSTWTLIAGSSATLSTSGSMLAGMAVTSHSGGDLSTVTFDTLNFSNTVPPPPGCIAGWTCQDVGIPLIAGSQSNSAGAWTIQGAGGDIWEASDEFHFVSQSLAADGSVSAHVTSQTNTSVWAKAGVMLRQSSDPAAPYYAAYITPSNGIVVQYRTTQGSNAQQSANITTATVPTYLMVARSGNTYTAYTSSDGFIWTPIAGSDATISMSGPVLAGLAVTSHDTGSLSTAIFDTVNISTTLPCTGGWGCADIGAPTQVGSQSLSGGTWTIQAGGADIAGVTDQFHFVAQPLVGDGSASARVVTETNTSSWAKAGVMLRQSIDPAAAYYFAFVSPGNGIVVQYRTALGSKMGQKTSWTGTVPAYLKVARAGNTYTTYTSSDGITWTSVAASVVTISMNGSALAGLAFTSHNAPVLGTATFDNVNVAGTPSPPSCPTGWSCADIGAPALAGSQSLSGGTWTIQAAGADIAGVTDQFHFVWQSLAADGSASARVITETNTSSWAKAGVMLRQSTDPASAYYFAFVSPGNGIVVQCRTASGNQIQQKTSFTGTVPAYLSVARTGNTYTAYTSNDGVTWTPIAGSSATITSMSGPVLAGLAFTSHNAPALGTATFDNVSISTAVP